MLIHATASSYVGWRWSWYRVDAIWNMSSLSTVRCSFVLDRLRGCFLKVVC